MAKETQDTVGEVEEMPVNDSASEADERESSKIGLAMNPATADADAADEAAGERSTVPRAVALGRAAAEPVEIVATRRAHLGRTSRNARPRGVAASGAQ